MNIFFLSNKPDEAAKFQCDKHVVKMILESAQILSTVHHLLSESPPTFIYKKTHSKHPCVIWACSSTANYRWLAMHGLALCDEYLFRYKKTHKSQEVLLWLSNHMPPITNHRFLDPPQCMPDEYKLDSTEYVKAYRTYYIEDKKKNIKPFNYTNRGKPQWMKLNNIK